MKRAGTLEPGAEPAASRWVVALASVVIFVVVFGIVYGLPARTGREAEVGVLPSVNAGLNALASLFLVIGYVFVRRRNFAAHKASMLTACGVSLAFLVTYLTHHARVGSVAFGGTGWIRSVYFAFLIPHILLATAIVPLVLLTLYRGLTGRFDRHRRIARWTLPIWLYVSVSGVVVYLMLYHL